VYAIFRNITEQQKQRVVNALVKQYAEKLAAEHEQHAQHVLAQQIHALENMLAHENTLKHEQTCAVASPERV
jgi:DNA-binding transcriptional regulator GbsR (MarR family)